MIEKKPFTSNSLRHEIVLEQHIVDKLITNLGYRLSNNEEYDKKSGLIKSIILEFIKNTQNTEWQRLEAQYATNSEAEFFKQLEKAIKQRGTLDVLRQGIKLIPGIKFSLCFFKPASKLNEKLVELYDANILSCIRQLKYSLKNENELDVALFVNGIAIATLELKNLLTGSTFKHAEKQYRTDRAPAGEAILTFKQGALVHFAMDEDNVSMTTKLANGKTKFLPFNRGRDGGAGNPNIADEFRVAYLYCDQPEGKAIFSREILLDIIGRFIHLDNNDGKETLIFPRFQQLDAVTKILEHAKLNGSGNNYLIQHSAGSGKSNTIGWTAHRLISLHDSSDQPIFQTVIIVTDRIVLDRQLQNTVAQFEQTKGVVKKIDGSSRQLKDAIQNNAKIIITTIHKFSTDHLREISGQSSRRFAILIDEAHGSQSGSHADNLSKALSRKDNSQENTIEDVILEYQNQRGPQKNISYIAFTATPRNVTLERFGTKNIEGLPEPFHLYSMRQAIEENFILDVLQNYMTYKSYYQLEKSIQDDPLLSGRQAQRRVARFASLHPTAIAQKVEVIVEHFRRHVLVELDGQAKAMVVTQSREHALRYFFGIKKYIQEQNYSGIKALVAFSGDLEYEDQKYSEAELNGFGETELPNRFDSAAYQLLIVAEKYQTGFDQPKLCAMYVDRKLDGLQAVQTLSRLNRTYAGKEKTFILDFQNSVDDIQTAFKPYFEQTTLEAISDPNQIYELEARIRSFSIIDNDEIDRFSSIYYADLLDTQDRIKLEAIVRSAVHRFDFEDDEGKQEEFRQLLKSYMRFYSFVSQVVKLEDTGLEKLYAYSTWLARLLPNRLLPAEIEISDNMIRLQAFRVEQNEARNGSLTAGLNNPLSAINEFGANSKSEDDEKSLSEIVNSFNQKHGTSFTSDDFLRFEKVNKDILNDDNLRDMLRNNPHDVVYGAFSHAFFDGVIKLFQHENQFQNIVMTDTDARNQAIGHFFNKAISEARQGL